MLVLPKGSEGLLVLPKERCAAAHRPGRGDGGADVRQEEEVFEEEVDGDGLERNRIEGPDSEIVCPPDEAGGRSRTNRGTRVHEIYFSTRVQSRVTTELLAGCRAACLTQCVEKWERRVKLYTICTYSGDPSTKQQQAREIMETRVS